MVKSGRKSQKYPKKIPENPKKRSNDGQISQKILKKRINNGQKSLKIPEKSQNIPKKSENIPKNCKKSFKKAQ